MILNINNCMYRQDIILMPCHNYTYEYFINRNHLTKKIVQLFFIYHYKYCFYIKNVDK
ncbi:hypothetical protein SARI_02497 [Salmonella enterica subsp. arizonae serovar 62:z4,z23:-]|uniref:Uncharacterized protein n=3 Tax=Salmonella enterica TaxID=28901 RepID=A9MM33_SALAR|nr:hypothetical protein SARI_02497 [Salmonella enterica subsp. arizonae serovar 62:z4,z23:-]